MTKLFLSPLSSPIKSLKNLTFWLLKDTRRAALTVALTSLSMLLAAYYFQYVVKLLPCYLCYLERKPHMILVGLGLITALIQHKQARIVLLAFMALVALTNSGIALFHVGVEYHWWEGLKTCASPTAVTTTLEEARDLIFSDKVVVPCDKPAWVLLGISMAGWNGLICFGLCVFSGFAAKLACKNRA